MTQVYPFPRVLIYTVAVELVYRNLAAMLATSLRRQGFGGSLIVISNDADVPGWRTVRTEATGRAAINRLRMLPGDLLHLLYGHDYALYLDADCLAVAPLTGIFANPDVTSRVCAQRYHRRVGSHLPRGYDGWHRIDLSAWSACSGAVGFPVTEAAAFLREWLAADLRWGTCPALDPDPSLNVVLHERYAGRFGYLPFVTEYPDTVGPVVHYMRGKALMSEHLANGVPPPRAVMPPGRPATAISAPPPTRPECAYWSDCGVKGGGCCGLNRYGGKPSLGVCRMCVGRGENRVTGLGDTVAALLNATGVGPIAKKVIEAATGKPCGCEERQAALNEAASFKG